MSPAITIASGLISLHGSFPLKYCEIRDTIFGILVEPPTKTISVISPLESLLSTNTFSTGFKQFLNKSSHKDSNLALVILV